MNPNLPPARSVFTISEDCEDGDDTGFGDGQDNGGLAIQPFEGSRAHHVQYRLTAFRNRHHIENRFKKLFIYSFGIVIAVLCFLYSVLNRRRRRDLQKSISAEIWMPELDWRLPTPQETATLSVANRPRSRRVHAGEVGSWKQQSPGETNSTPPYAITSRGPYSTYKIGAIIYFAIINFLPTLNKNYIAL